ncbi:MAG: amidase family protein, partial [Dehalococcoidia bacterium]|nr:amidase family protein [Dehalococcoidia bacterium]
MTYSQTYELSISKASELIRNKKLSPVDLLEDHIKRVEAKDEHLNSFITRTFDRAMKQARICEQEITAGNWKGPLHGIPLAVKDLFYTKDIVTTIGSQKYKSFIPTFNATVVDKLEHAGAVMMGKLNMHELAFGTTGKNSVFGDCHNPWNTMKITGGSSSGSAAAVSGGLCMGSLGTDTGGSIRIPAGLCGIVGLKPTFGRVSRKGVFPLSNSLDTVGPMARTVKDAQIMLSAIAGVDAKDKHNSSRENDDLQMNSKVDLNTVKIAIPTDYFFDVISDYVNNSIDTAI